MDTVPVQLPKSLYDLVARRAALRHQAPARLVEEILSEQLMPQHPYVEIIDSRTGPRSVVKSTRVGVDVIVGYSQAGYTPRDIVDSVLPHLTLAQVYDALSYYEDHRAEIEHNLLVNSPEAWRDTLQQHLGDEATRKLLGE
ncbi:hypothetical protein PLCT2_01928 [Planctomycetaceae bacterium]|nr:hypothetical protein PLCT2_01928 [Planctomycetaceae bacterium]